MKTLKITLIISFVFVLYFLFAAKSFAAQITIDGTVNANNESQKGRNLVWVDRHIGYFFYVDVTTNDLVYVKTTTGGRTWGAIQTVNSGSVTKTAVWYDKWTTGDTGTKIHIAYIETGAIDAKYRDLDTSNDTLGTDTIAINLSGGTGSWLYSESEISITKARGGNLYIAAASTAGTHGFYRCTGTCNTGTNWTSRAAIFETSVTDGVILMPGGESDNQDILALYWDFSADEISLKTYDDSANSVSETSISTGMVENTTYGVQWSAVQRQSDNHVVLAAWNALDTATADLKMWDITNSSSITAKTNIITDQAETANISLMINQSDNTIYAAYFQGNTFTNLIDAVYKLTVSGGATWSAQARFSVTEDDLRYIDAGTSITNESGRFQPIWFNDDLNDMITSYAYIWDGGGGDTNWNTAANWLTDTAPSLSSDWLVFSAVSSKSATFNTSPSVGGIHILPWYSGTLTQSSTNTITLDALGYSQNSGVFTGGSGDITLTPGSNSHFSQGGGIFNSTSGSLIIGGHFSLAGGVFIQTSGTVEMYIPDGSTYEMTGSPTFYNLYFFADACCNGPVGIILNSGIFTVNGTLTFESIGSRKDVLLSDNGGAIHAKGNLETLSYGWAGYGNVVINGTGAQTLTGQTTPIADEARYPSITIDKQSGTLTISNTVRVVGNWTYTQGALSTSGSTVIFHTGDVPFSDTTISGTHSLNNVTMEFNNCCNGRNLTIASGTLTATGNVLITNLTTINNVWLEGPGILSIEGNFTIDSGVPIYTGSTLGITLSGPGNQTVNIASAITLPSGNWTINKSSGTVTLAANLTLNNTGQDLVISSGTLNLAGFNLTVNDQFTLGSTATLKLQGGETASTLDTVTSGSTVEYTGSGTYSSLVLGDIYSNLAFSGSGSFTPAANLTVGLDFTQSAGTFNVAPSGMTVSRNFTRTGGTFIPGSSTLTFDNPGYISSISGTTTFYNLTSISSGKTFRFASNSTTTVSNALTLRGSNDGLISLESTDTGYPWHLNVNGTATLEKLDVSDSYACGGTTQPLTATGSVDGGNNSCWNISGSYTDWYNSNWSKRRLITIDHTKVAGSLTDFPVLINLASDSSLATYAQDDADDILFTTDDGSTLLSYEIESFNGTTGSLQAWVKIANLSSSADTKIYMYYGNSAATSSLQSPTSVWDSNFRMVQHMEETGTCNLTFTDSTSRGNNGSCNDTPANIGGQIGYARDFDGTEYISVSDSSGDFDVSTFTISAWVKRDTASGNGDITNVDGDEAQFYGNGNNRVSLWGFCGSDVPATGNNAIDTTNWYHVSLTIGGGTGKIYINGQEANSDACSGTLNTTIFGIGSASQDDEQWDGKIDEVKFSNSVRTAEWVETEYNNQSSPSTFFAISQEASTPIINVRGGVKINPGTRIIGN